MTRGNFFDTAVTIVIWALIILGLAFVAYVLVTVVHNEIAYTDIQLDGEITSIDVGDGVIIIGVTRDEDTFYAKVSIDNYVPVNIGDTVVVICDSDGTKNMVMCHQVIVLEHKD